MGGIPVGPVIVEVSALGECAVGGPAAAGDTPVGLVIGDV